jgi:hypothetical protein
MTFLRIVPMAFVMVAGPQIISAIIFATSERAREDSLAYVAGAMLAVVVETTIFFLIANALNLKSSTEKGGHAWVDWLLVALLVILAIRVFLGRKESEPPRWMGRLETASPRFAFRLGLVLFFAMPTDVLTMLTVAGYLAAHNASLLDALPFFILTALFIASPLIVLLLFGKRAQRSLPKIRDWMNDNSWIVSEIVILFFLVMEVNDALSG